MPGRSHTIPPCNSSFLGPKGLSTVVADELPVAVTFWGGGAGMPMVEVA